MAGKNELIAINDKWRTAFSASLNDFENWILSAIIAPIHLIATNGTAVYEGCTLAYIKIFQMHCSNNDNVLLPVILGNANIYNKHTWINICQMYDKSFEHTHLSNDFIKDSYFSLS